MEIQEARALLIRLDGRVRHGWAAGLTRKEEIAVRLKAGGGRDGLIGYAIGSRTQLVPGVLSQAAKKLIGWHRQQAQDVLACCDNRPLRERATYEDPQTGERVEVRPMQSAEDEKVRIHPDVKPTARELTRRTEAALSVLLD